MDWIGDECRDFMSWWDSWIAGLLVTPQRHWAEDRKIGYGEQRQRSHTPVDQLASGYG